MRLLVCGGRDYDDIATLHRKLQALHDLRPISVLIHGAAMGADSMAGSWARHRGIPEHPYPADWTKHRKAAGPIRNQQMLDEGKPDLVIAFPWRYGNGRHGAPSLESWR